MKPLNTEFRKGGKSLIPAGVLKLLVAEAQISLLPADLCITTYQTALTRPNTTTHNHNPASWDLHASKKKIPASVDDSNGGFEFHVKK